MDDTLSVKSFSRDDDAKQLEPEESIVKDEKPIAKKCPNLTFNCIYQICDILVALSLLFWAYCLSPKNTNTFSNITEPSLSMFISRSIITLYFVVLSIMITLCTFYYPFKTKSIYFNFYGRGILFLFLGSFMLLIASIANENILSTTPVTVMYDSGYYSAHYVTGIGILYLLFSMITNPKCGAKYCFLPSPFIQLKHGRKLKFKSNSHYDEINKSEDEVKMEKQLSIVVELATIDTKNENDKHNKAKRFNDNSWIQKDKKNNTMDHKISKLEIDKTSKNKNKRKSLNDIKKTKVKTAPVNKYTAPKNTRRQSEIIVSQTSESFQNRLSVFKNNAAGLSNQKIDKLKNERKENDKNMKQDTESKRRATVAIQTYATQAAAHSQDINLLNKSLKNITKSNCMEKMREMGLLVGIYVPINEYQRWDIRSKLDKIIHSEDIKEQDRDNLNGTKKTNKKEYVKMHVFNLRNNALLTKISADQKADFYKLLQYSIETVSNIYMMDFTRANANKGVLNIIFEALITRLNNKKTKFGPEEILLESNPITDNGCGEIINYISKNPKDLRVLRLSNSFHSIGSQVVVSFCDVMEHNNNIIKFSLDISYLMYNNRMDGYIRRNNNLWRDNKKSNPVNMIKRKSYDFMRKKSRHKARRSSVPNLHKAHPSLAAIRGGFSVDKEAKNKSKSKKKGNKKSKHVKRRSSVPDAAKIIHAMPTQSRNRYNFNLKKPKIDPTNKRRSSVPPKPNKNIIDKFKANSGKESKRKSVANNTPKKNISESKMEEDSSSSDDDLNDLMSGNMFKNATHDNDNDIRIRSQQ